MRLLALLLLAACGGSASTGAARPATAEDRDLHRHLDEVECGRLHDFMVEKGWLSTADAPRADVVKGCLESPEATRAFLDCVLASDTREESERCQ